MTSRRVVRDTGLLALVLASPVPLYAHAYGRVSVSPWVEVTQSIQTMGAEIGLSAHKPTVVRAYLQAQRYRQSGGLFHFHVPSFAPIEVSGTLTVRSGGVVIATLRAVNEPLLLTPWTLWPNSGNANSSLNFSLADPPAGDVTFELDIRTSALGISVVDPPPVTKRFHHNRPLRIQAVKLQYDHDNNAATPPTKSPQGSMVLDGKDWLVKSGPLAPCKVLYWVNPTPLQWGIEDVSTNVALSNGPLQAALAGLRTQGSVTYDQVYGWWQGSVFGNGWSQLPASCLASPGVGAFGNTDPTRYQRTFAHEIYHNYYQEHLNDGPAHVHLPCDAFPGPDNSTGQIGAVGWDTTLGQPVPASKLDVMVPARLTAQAWIAPERYRLLWNRWSPAAEPTFDLCHTDWWRDTRPSFQPFGPQLVLTEPDAFLIISGFVRADGGAKLLPAWELLRSLDVEPPSKEGSFSVVLIGRDGQPVDERRFEPRFEGDSKAPGAFSFSFVLPVPRDGSGERDLSEIRLLGRSELLDRIGVTASPPELEILSPSPTETPVLEKPFALRWRASDPDGGFREGLHFAVQYSPDDGEHFLGLANYVQGDSVVLDPGELPGGSQAHFRVLVTDGVNTAEKTIGPFAVPRKAPTVRIISPPQKPLTVVAAGRSLALVGAGDSPDDGVIPGPRLRWFSDIDGELGTGHTIEARLSEGMHTITLTGADREEVESSAEVQVSVVPEGKDEDADGTADYADRCPAEPGPPANGGCPYEASNQPLDLRLTAHRGHGRPRFVFRSLEHVVLRLDMKNPRPTPVRLGAVRLQLTDPNGDVVSAEAPFHVKLAPGERLDRVLALSEVFGHIPSPAGAFSVVLEAADRARAPVAHAATVFFVLPRGKARLPREEERE